MPYVPNPQLSDSERLIVIETLLVNTLESQAEQDKKIADQALEINKIKRVLYIGAGAIIGITGIGWTTILSTIPAL